MFLGLVLAVLLLFLLDIAWPFASAMMLASILAVMMHPANTRLRGLWGALVVGSVDNILRPLVIGARDKQNPVLVGFAMLGGTSAIGPLGLLIGPLVISLTGAVVEEIQKMNPHASGA